MHNIFIMMRWKILEAAENSSSLEDVLSHFKDHSTYGLEEEGILQILRLYKNTLSEEIQRDLDAK
ncbi:hypothetical protein N9D02_08705 [Emcibacteraceae bacterium]|nr:hypothetical protein [Kordiimonadaceae bacterium]MDA9554013.1 hypothetical protein [Emcibacteraceae bacterium]MDA9771098.1 hypothetical protein [Emcibacteraceae bacterium]